MKFLPIFALATAAATTAMAEETRQLDSHEHGVGQLDIAFEGQKIAMVLHAPGADIVGFEYGAKSAEDRAAVDAAVAMLARPMELFVLPDAAGCNVIQAAAELESEEEHDAHDDHADEHKDEDDTHVDHDDEHKDEHDTHADHDDEHKDGHEEHAEEAGHTEFHAEYVLTCTDPDAVTEFTFAYFDAFPNAVELEVQVLSDKGAKAFEVTRDAPKLDLRGMF